MTGTVERAAAPGPSSSRRRRALGLAVAAALLVVGGVGLWQAATGGPPTRAEQAQAVASGLRCPSCQSTSVADSPAQIAQEMRQIIDEQLAAGRSTDQVTDWFVARYGPWIRLDPPADGPGVLLWTLPVLALAVAVAAVRHVVRRRSAETEPVAATPVGPAAADVDALLADVQAGRLHLDDSPAGERLAGIAVLLRDVRADDPAGRTPATHAVAAQARVAVREWEQQQQQQRPTVPTPPARPEPTRRARAVAWSALVAVFATALVALLAPSIRDRGAGDQITGDPLRQPGAATAAAAEQPVPPVPPTLAELEQAVRDAPDDVPARLALGDALDAAGRLGEAAAQYSAAVDAAPGDATPAIRLAFAVLRQGDEPQARALLAEVLAREPDLPDALLLLGSIEMRRGDPAGRPRLERFLQVAPDHPAGTQVRDVLAGRTPSGGTP